MSEDQLPKDILKALNAFGKIGLEDLPKNVLMDRIDRKFIVDIDQVGQLLEGMEKHYNIIEAADDILAPYESVYFDTVDFLFYRKHHSGFGHRSKVRFRSYPKTNTTFLELKKKNNKGRTSKVRIRTDRIHKELNQDALSFLRDELESAAPEELHPAIEINYDRIGLIAKDGNERLSIDFDLTAIVDNKRVDFGHLAILEVKQDNITYSPIIEHLRNCGVREASMSKYCLALSLLKPELKSNAFKPALQRLRKIEKETIYEV